MDNIAFLVLEAKKGCQNAFAELYEISKKEVWFTCIGLLKNETNAQDAMQNTYISAFTKLSSLEQPSSFCSWIKKIAANKCKDFLKGKVEFEFDEEYLENITDTDELVLPEEYISNTEKRQCIMMLLEETLSAVQYQTVMLYYFDELSVTEIAEFMGCPEGTVMSRLNLARSKMKKSITEYEKKNEDKLHSVVPIPLFGSLFSVEAKNMPVPQIALNIPQNIISANTLSTAAKAGGKIMSSLKAKIIIGICATVAVGSVVTAGIIISNNNNGNNNNTPSTPSYVSSGVSETLNSSLSDVDISSANGGLNYSDDLENGLQDMAYSYLSNLVAENYDASIALLKLPKASVVTAENVKYCMTRSDYKAISDLDIKKVKFEIREAGYSNSDCTGAYVVFNVIDTTSEDRDSSRSYTVSLKLDDNDNWYVDDNTFYNTNFSFHVPSGDIELSINGVKIDGSCRTKENTSYFSLLDMYTIPYIDKKDVDLTVKTKNYEYTYTIKTESDNDGERYMLYDILKDEEEAELCKAVQTIFTDVTSNYFEDKESSSIKNLLADDCVEHLDTTIWNQIKSMMKPNGISGIYENEKMTQCLKSDKDGGGSYWLSDDIVCVKFRYELQFNYRLGSYVQDQTMHRYGALLLKKDGDKYKIYSLEADKGLFSTANHFCNDW